MHELDQDFAANRAALDALVEGRHGDPFALLGVHRHRRGRIVRCFQPGAAGIEMLGASGESLGEMRRVHPHGLFTAPLPARKRRYCLRVVRPDGSHRLVEDPYRFPSTLSEIDRYLLGEGSDQRIYDKLGAHLSVLGGVRGTRFAVWAPNASRVSVVGDFNDWDGRVLPMRLHPGNGIWELFVPGVGHGERYKFELLDRRGNLLPLKADPFARFHEGPPGNACLVHSSHYAWRDAGWQAQRPSTPRLDRPVSIYEVHLGSWRRKPEAHNRCLSYRELAAELVPYVTELGYTHIELLPVTEHPFAGSWGYQPIGLFSPTQRFGDPDDFRYFVDACHQAGLGVIVDWVPAHFPRDEHGLCRFDGTALYEHEDPRKGEHAEWGTLVFNFGRREVVNYLIGSALYWIEAFHIDGLRVDAVASMLYLDYSRKDGDWLANEHGGNENLEAVAFLQRLNTALHAHRAVSYAEESTAWPAVSRPVDQGGLGFTYKWNMGWMHDTLVYMSEDSVHRKHHHDKMTFGLIYAFDENFVLPLSHDEVVHGKGSLLGRMPGDDWQRFANLRAYFGSLFAHPGKKLLFMGSEIAQHDEWCHDRSLDWHLLEQAPHRGVQALVRDLNRLYRATPALYERDFVAEGFEWLHREDRDNSVFAWLRRDRHGGYAICIANFTPVIREGYRLGVPELKPHVEWLNTDDRRYGGSGVGNDGLDARPVPAQGRPASIELRLPPLATLIIGPAA